LQLPSDIVGVYADMLTTGGREETLPTQQMMTKPLNIINHMTPVILSRYHTSHTFSLKHNLQVS